MQNGLPAKNVNCPDDCGKRSGASLRPLKISIIILLGNGIRIDSPVICGALDVGNSLSTRDHNYQPSGTACLLIPLSPTRSSTASAIRPIRLNPGASPCGNLSKLGSIRYNRILTRLWGGDISDYPVANYRTPWWRITGIPGGLSRNTQAINVPVVILAWPPLCFNSS